MKFMEVHEFYGNSKKFPEDRISLLDGSLYAPMAENVDISKGLLLVPEIPQTGKYGKSYGCSLFHETLDFFAEFMYLQLKH